MAHRSVGHPVGFVITLKIKRWRHLGGPHSRAMTIELKLTRHLSDVRQTAIAAGIVHAITDHEIIADGKADIVGMGQGIGPLLIQNHRDLHASRARISSASSRVVKAWASNR